MCVTVCVRGHLIHFNQIYAYKTKQISNVKKNIIHVIIIYNTYSIDFTLFFYLLNFYWKKDKNDDEENKCSLNEGLNDLQHSNPPPHTI